MSSCRPSDFIDSFLQQLFLQLYFFIPLQLYFHDNLLTPHSSQHPYYCVAPTIDDTYNLYIEAAREEDT